MTTTHQPLSPLNWTGSQLELLDQRQLPERIEYLHLDTPEEVWEAIRSLAVRGAPAIGIAAAYGVVLGSAKAVHAGTNAWLEAVKRHAGYLATSRPTAVNLFWALDRMTARAEALAASGAPAESCQEALVREAEAIHAEDIETNRLIGEHALTLLADGMGVLTHCNAGGLATAKYGTALAPFYLAAERGIKLRVFADETRPVLQGARLTAFELHQAGIDVTLICDNMAAAVMRAGWVQAVIVGTDRVAANGDVANKIGTYGVAVLAKAHGIPFYVACPLSTIDLNTPTGAEIPIEERPAEEITEGFGRRTAPRGVRVYNPAFDVTPAEYVDAIITERGIVRPPYDVNLRALFETK
ncbi:MAG: S-methyl-5-thioribose-1-phosphate isomerase [Thermobacillus sp.]|uniref:Methylthioribose-1-phosphate isomerase n=1 Tax=Thermobacillus composti (strain DSM 18247 / JCM 13945 / KWC4) TaxID=717605 RepID=L0EGD8_THECK|nr:MULTISPECIES: S-methyl-5-thioribose-1-phosphate isomerase [Thermobacillus]AGA58761.1 S-methyl-5-thioribose-1-phosphate isomerase [Thermobacillus composti KWC4]REK54068.1 MAG: S-methyl-5-thioribose-1-phosphate isomerase [Thermobacillus sp.]